MTTGNKVAPTSTAWQARVILYQPSQRPKEVKGQWMETSFGRCRVTGRLGQRHADIVETILYVAEQRREISDGGIELLVDPAKVRRTLSDAQYSYGRIQKLLLDLRVATVEIITHRAGEKRRLYNRGTDRSCSVITYDASRSFDWGRTPFMACPSGCCISDVTQKRFAILLSSWPHSSATTWY